MPDKENDLVHRGLDKQIKLSEPNRPYERIHRQAVFLIFAGVFWLSLILFISGDQMEAVQTSSAAQKEPAQSAPAAATQSSDRASQDAAWDPDWPSLPGKGKPAKPIKEVQAMYAFAARHPEILEYAPCYCGCDRRLRHKSVLDCFIKGRDAKGGPQWDVMGFT